MNETTNHTPGPWQSRFNSQYRRHEVVQVVSGDWVACCDRYPWDESTGKSNGDLIAAAPELLEALERCYRLLDSLWLQTDYVEYDDEREWRDIELNIPKLIKKAKGEGEPK